MDTEEVEGAATERAKQVKASKNRAKRQSTAERIAPQLPPGWDVNQTADEKRAVLAELKEQR